MTPTRTPDGTYVFSVPCENYTNEDMAILAYLTGLGLPESRLEIDHAQQEYARLRRMLQGLMKRIETERARRRSTAAAQDELRRLRRMVDAQFRVVNDCKRVLQAKLTTRKRKILT